MNNDVKISRRYAPRFFRYLTKTSGGGGGRRMSDRRRCEGYVRLCRGPADMQPTSGRCRLDVDMPVQGRRYASIADLCRTVYWDVLVRLGRTLFKLIEKAGAQ